MCRALRRNFRVPCPGRSFLLRVRHAKENPLCHDMEMQPPCDIMERQVGSLLVLDFTALGIRGLRLSYCRTTYLAHSHGLQTSHLASGDLPLILWGPKHGGGTCQKMRDERLHRWQTQSKAPSIGSPASSYYESKANQLFSRNVFAAPSHP